MVDGQFLTCESNASWNLQSMVTPSAYPSAHNSIYSKGPGGLVEEGRTFGSPQTLIISGA